MVAKTAGIDVEQLKELLLNPAIQRYAAQATEPLGDTGPLRANTAGQIILELADVVLTFRTPTLGDYETLMTAAEEATAEPPEGEKPDEEAVAWWRRAADLLCDAPLPARSKLPMWLFNPVLVAQAQNVWLVRPTQAPGT